MLESAPLFRIALGIEYNGSRYHGWQRQQKVKSVQGCLEKALSKIANQPINVFCAGRTDTGVHATGQVVHFETSIKRKESAWTVGGNRYCPEDIAIRWYQTVSNEFHARFSAIARRYQYIIFNHPYRPAILSNIVMHVNYPIDEKKMDQAAQALLGEHDFTSFRSVNCQSRTSWRHVMHVHVTRYCNYIIVDIKANAFLYHMVRNIVGSLLEIGRGYQDINWIEKLLVLKDRTKAAETAQARGLYLVSVDYPNKFSLPLNIMVPVFLSDALI
ncbi:tRNA pseudouridine synthase A [Candidatus Hartigia pinicola]|nr:tRNA pseudouridine synthase A [Candidatus Hartigia pinicola]